jgi:hypothetical protein
MSNIIAFVGQCGLGSMPIEEHIPLLHPPGLEATSLGGHGVLSIEVTLSYAYRMS